ncbi:MAG: NADH:ubiquinone oxidoreductase subunit NDUFA12 [Pseudomonadota bacterium]
MSVFARIFTWWHDSTVGTALHTWRHGDKVGEDDQGNRYYRSRRSGEQERRWVMYNGEIEASRIPPEWHAWLHYTVPEPPSERPPVVKSWEKDHVPNLTGKDGAYFPPGSLASTGTRETSSGDYEAWSPES